MDALREFLHAEAAGGIALALTALVALVWANSPVGDSYGPFWQRELTLGVEPVALSEDLRHWVNDGLMAGGGAGLAAGAAWTGRGGLRGRPDGYGLSRFLTDHGIGCLVAAPSKLQRPSGDRVKTDATDALHLARLLRLGEIRVTAAGLVYILVHPRFMRA